MPRVAVVLFVVALAVLVWRVGEEPIGALEMPALRAAPEVFEAPRAASRPGETFEELRVGSFERPEDVPAYEILEERPTGGDGVRSARLLIDTRSRSQEDFTLIARDLKARYADYDFISVEFTDISMVIDYHGGAVIVNTPVGSQRAGFLFGPPSTGYYVRAAD